MRTILNSYKLILASGSPRRKELLEKSGLMPHDIRVKAIDESFDPYIDVLDVAPYIAARKAEIFDDIEEDEVYITADTVVIHQGVIYGKPADREDAIRMLTTLQGSQHTVVTGVCLRKAYESIVFSDISHVTVSPMNIEEITYYIDEYTPYDKAGSYGIQDWLGICKVEAIEGSYTNIMGMPMHRLYQELYVFCS